jgi:hypothetical protein
MFCRQWTGTHALIKPTDVLRPPTNDPPEYPRFRYRSLLSFPQAVLIRHPGGLGVVLEIDRDALFGIAFWRLRRRWEKLCFSSLRNMPNAGGYPRASQPDSKNNNFRPVQAMRPREADGVHHSSVHNSSRAQRAVSARGSSALDTGNVDHYGTA